VRVLGEIPPPSSPPAAGALRRRDLEAFERLLAELPGVGSVALGGEAACRRTTAIGLATAAAARGIRTVLVESEMGDPTLAEALGLATAPGLSDYLRGEADAGGVLKPLVLAGPGSIAAREPLICVVGGRPVAEPLALLRSDALRRVVAGLRGAYELVVLEAGEARVDHDGSLPLLAAQAEATLFCVGGMDGVPQPPFPVTGLVVQRS